MGSRIFSRAPVGRFLLSFERILFIYFTREKVGRANCERSEEIEDICRLQFGTSTRFSQNDVASRTSGKYQAFCCEKWPRRRYFRGGLVRNIREGEHEKIKKRKAALTVRSRLS